MAFEEINYREHGHYNNLYFCVSASPRLRVKFPEIFISKNIHSALALNPEVVVSLILHYTAYMAHTVTITVDDSVYETLKPFIEQQTVGEYLSKIIGKNSPTSQALYPDIVGLRGSLHQIDTSDIRDMDNR